MPARRTPASGHKRRSSQARSKTSQRAPLSALQRDLIGIALIILACLGIVALVIPTSAPVSLFVADTLRVLFGSMALLCPCAILVFATCFFFAPDERVYVRIALGLAFIVWAILALVALDLAQGQAHIGSQIFSLAAMKAHGGALGASLAFLLAWLMGDIAARIILYGLIVIGLVVCGFSISDTVQKYRVTFLARLEERRKIRQHRQEQRIIDASADPDFSEDEFPVREISPFPDLSAEPKTTFLGARKTSVLKRKNAQADTPVFVDIPEPPTTKLPEEPGSQEPVTRVMPQEKKSRTKKATQSPLFDTETLAPSEKAVDVSSLDANAPLTSPPQFSGSEYADYQLPPLSMLAVNTKASESYVSEEELTETAKKLQETFVEFGLSSRVEGWIAGPSVTTFKILRGEGERVNKIIKLEDDLALSLAVKSVRIFSPILGTSYVGIEIPNEKPQPVFLSDVLPMAKGHALECAFGRDAAGVPMVIDLTTLPHLLVAGTTGSGKSVLLNSIVMSLLMRTTPEQVRLIMIDPKRVEFSGYAGLPHLYVPVVTEPRQAASALQWGVTEMERRLKVFQHYKVRQISSYNENVDGGKYADMENPPKHMPYFVIIIDELADLMMVAGKDVETSIARIAQLGRAAGIHLIVATQRPSADVVTGLIRANLDNRVALSVDNQLNSRIILDDKGAEQLLGKGDMLVKLRGQTKPTRAQGCWVSDDEIEQTVQFIREQATAEYHEDILTQVVPQTPGVPDPSSVPADDPLLWQAAQIIVDSQLGSTSSLQRALAVGYARAGRIMDMLEAKGVVGPANGSKPRDVLLDKEALEELKIQDAAYREV